MSGTLIGTLNVANTGGWSSYQLQSTAISGATGVHDLYLVGAGGQGVGNLDYFVFQNTANNAPTVSITAPTNGASFAQGANINVSASASDSDGSISKVEFFNGSTSLGVDNSSPYTITISNAAASTYNLKAVATDNGNASTTSSAVSITVNVPSSNTNPFVKIEAENFDGQSSLNPFQTGFGYFDSGDWAKYDNLDFGSGAASFDVYLTSANSGRSIQLRLDGVSGTLIGTLNVTNTGGWSNYQLQSTSISGATGVHDLYLVGAGGQGVGNLDYFVFQPSGTSTSSSNPITAYYGQGQYSDVTLKATASEGIYVYPNPSIGGLNLNLPGSSAANIKIFDSQGANVYHQEDLKNKDVIGVEKLTPGLYFVAIEIRGSVITQQLIIR